MRTSEYILIYRGFARSSSCCHAVLVEADVGSGAVILGELDDNPGTTVRNAIEQVAEAVRRELLGGDGGFDLYEYDPKGMPRLLPTFYRVRWGGGPGSFLAPEWHAVEPERDEWLRGACKLVRADDYNAKALIAERALKVVDAREREELPLAG